MRGFAPPQRVGRPKTYSDSTILKIVMLMHLTGKRGETETLRETERHYRQYFTQVPPQSCLWHRIHAALSLIEQFRQALRTQLGVEYEDLRVLDSMPLPVATLTTRPGQGNGLDLADWGHCASKKLTYRGFKLGLLITDQGIPDVYDLFSARPHDVQLLTDLLGDQAQIIGSAIKASSPLPNKPNWQHKRWSYSPIVARIKPSKIPPWSNGCFSSIGPWWKRSCPNWTGICISKMRGPRPISAW